ncbi:MAG: hypothetical protein AAB152_12015 [Candidatus Coatesbacteria bacterium]|mgnify:CR=1 FL=1
MSAEQPGQRRLYYSARKHGVEPLTIQETKELFVSAYKALDGLFLEAFGVRGSRGRIADPKAYFLIHTRKKDLWPPANIIFPHFSEDDLFDVIEVLHDVVSIPRGDGWNGEYDFDKEGGQIRYRDAMNEFLPQYGDGWELSPEGYVLACGPEGLKDLLAEDPPFQSVTNVGDKVNSAITRFRRHGASAEDKMVAVRDLIDAFEHQRSQAEKVLTEKDAADLFHIANRFGIRHNNPGQQKDYDPDIFHEWLFYYYLAALRACARLLHKESLPSFEEET